MRGHRGQNSGGGRFSRRSQISRGGIESAVARRISCNSNQLLQLEASRCNENQSELESAVDSRMSCYRSSFEQWYILQNKSLNFVFHFKYMKVISDWVSRNWSQSQLVSAATRVSRYIYIYIYFFFTFQINFFLFFSFSFFSVNIIVQHSKLKIHSRQAPKF